MSHPTQQGSDGNKPRFPLTMTPALQYIMDRNPERPFTAKDLRDMLNEMSKRGEFASGVKDHNNLLAAVHKTLKALAERGAVKTDTYEGKVRYFKTMLP